MTALTELDSLVLTRRRQLDALVGQARAVLLRGKDLKTEIEKLTVEAVTLERSTVLLNSLGEERQMKSQTVIESLVTRGLQVIFDSTLSFHILQTVKAKSASVEFIVRTTLPDGDLVDTPVMDARGGGLAATIGFLLRVVILLLRADEKQEKILVLDETFSHVSAEYLEGVGEFLREIVSKTGIQVVLVTHQSEFEAYADTIYRFSAVDGRTVVTAV